MRIGVLHLMIQLPYILIGEGNYPQLYLTMERFGIKHKLGNQYYR